MCVHVCLMSKCRNYVLNARIIYILKGDRTEHKNITAVQKHKKRRIMQQNDPKHGYNACKIYYIILKYSSALLSVSVVQNYCKPKIMLVFI